MGCAELPTIRNPFDGPPPAYKSQYGPTPAERVERLQQLDQTAATLSADQQATACTELTANFDSERDPIIRRQIVQTLGAFSNPAAVPVLVRATEDSDYRIRQAACVAWGRRPGPQALSVLSAMFANDSNDNVRLEACRAIGRFNSLDAIQQLANGLNDRNPAIQYASIQSLKQSTGQELGNNVNTWVEYVAGLSSPAATPANVNSDPMMIASPPEGLTGSMT
ncbi:MAG: HEAT repeat domain-containing protein, partial [Planctomycetota bacterium]